ncbi:hypothetical protein ACHAXR_013257, partial [Thalassiosira sp. AJA248-18]
MFDKMQEKERLVTANNGESKTKPNQSNAGHAPFHCPSSHLPRDTKQRSKWLIHDNNGSFNGWFDWLPMWMRVGYWNPTVILSLMFVYTAIVWFKPHPLEFQSTVLDKLDDEEEGQYLGMPRTTAIDLAIFTWGIAVIVQAKISLGSISAFPMSFTGWSWMLLTSRAGLDFGAWAAATDDNIQLASKLATIGSSIRLVTISNACV